MKRYLGIVLLSTLSTLLLAYCLKPQNLKDILDRKEWRFSKAELAALNAIPPQEFQSQYEDMDKKASTGITIPDGKLVDFKFLDPNGDGTAVLLSSYDVSGRRLMRDLIIHYRKDGSCRIASLDSFGGGISCWANGKTKLFIANNELIFGCWSPAPQTFPLLYAWDGSTPVEVSKDNWKYYREHFVPEAKKQLSGYMNGTGKDMQYALFNLIGLRLSIQKLEELFPGEKAFSEDEKEKTKQLIIKLYKKHISLEQAVPDAYEEALKSMKIAVSKK